MAERPFLLFRSRDDDGRRVLKVQGDGIPLTERPLTLADCVFYAKMFNDEAMEIVEEERRASAKKSVGQ